MLAVPIRLFGAIVALGLFASCNSGADAACGEPFAERIDPGSAQHLLPGAPEPTYVSNPPTSGAHTPGVIVGNVQTDELSKGAQVGLLEEGKVLLQYKHLSVTDRRQLRSFADEEHSVVVAPNDSLDKPIVATAWLYKMECRAVDRDAIDDFIRTHAKEHSGH